MVKGPFTLIHSEALAIIRLMGDAYKAGLRDAEWVNDAGRCNEHIAATQEQGVYGRVTDAENSDWRRWKHCILLMKDIRLANVRAVDFCARITSQICTEACLLPLVQDFYNQGLKDWNDAPVSRQFTGLAVMRYPRWTRKGLRNRTFKQMWVDMQTFALQRSDQYKGASSHKSLTPRKFERFSLETWRALQRNTEREYILKHG